MTTKMICVGLSKMNRNVGWNIILDLGSGVGSSLHFGQYLRIRERGRSGCRNLLRRLSGGDDISIGLAKRFLKSITRLAQRLSKLRQTRCSEQ